MTRITTGTAKNKVLKSPDIPGFQAVQEISKLAVFSMLGEKIQGSICLDLFSGSGNMGIEALSRGAAWCDFVDSNRVSVDTIKYNLSNCQFLDNAEVHHQESAKFAANTEKTYDIVFLDPFYADIKHKYLMEVLSEILNPKGIVIFFHGNNLDITDILKKTTFTKTDTRRYGKCLVDFLELS
jgi:16S rRNA (guanine(966)-N(2))-methyltransferase RsmD